MFQAESRALRGEGQVAQEIEPLSGDHDRGPRPGAQTAGTVTTVRGAGDGADPRDKALWLGKGGYPGRRLCSGPHGDDLTALEDTANLPCFRIGPLHRSAQGFLSQTGRHAKTQLTSTLPGTPSKAIHPLKATP